MLPVLSTLTWEQFGLRRALDLPTLQAPRMGLQALWEVNLRLATTDYLSNNYDDLYPGVTIPVLLSSTVTSLSACHVTYCIICCFFRCNRAWRLIVISSLSPLPK